MTSSMCGAPQYGAPQPDLQQRLAVYMQNKNQDSHDSTVAPSSVIDLSAPVERQPRGLHTTRAIGLVVFVAVSLLMSVVLVALLRHSDGLLVGAMAPVIDAFRRLGAALVAISLALAGATALCAVAWREHWLGRRRVAQSRAQASATHKSRDHFLSMVSHEMLSPIQVILSCVEIFDSKERLETSDPMWLRLKIATGSMHSQVSDLIDFARLSVGRMEIREALFKPVAVVEAVLDEYEGALIEKNLVVIWEPDSSLNTTVVSDPKRVRQILTNLYSNGIKYTPRGTITVTARVDPHAGELCIDVADTGLGMMLDQVQMIFEPYVRLPQAHHEAEGLGIGLSVVKTLVTAMRGEIRVQTRLGEGSTFSVRLPIKVDSHELDFELIDSKQRFTKTSGASGERHSGAQQSVAALCEPSVSRLSG